MSEELRSREELSRLHLRRAHRLLGLTQREVAERLNVDEGTYGAYERRTLVTSDALIRLRSILRQTTDYLLGFEDPCGLTEKERLLLERFRGARFEDLQENILEYARLQEEIAKRQEVTSGTRR